MSTEELDAAFASILAEVFEREADHWEAEYEHLSNRYGSYEAKKPRAAWRLGASMLRRRAQQYRTGTVSYLLPPSADSSNGDDRG